MSKTLRVSLIVIAVVVGAAALLLAGFALGRSGWGIAAGWPAGFYADQTGGFAYGPGMMGSGGYGPGMMGSGGYGPGMMGSGAYGPGMMGGGMMGSGDYGFGMMGGGMMGSSGLSAADPLTLQQAQPALDDYLTALNDNDLAIGEVMIFDNHAYAEIVELSSGIGAMEVLVDPVTLTVYPEHGPNMMWNLKYSPMAGYGGMMGWFGGRYGQQAPEASADMPVSAEQAVEAAQDYLDRYLPGAVVDEHADPFYGYYTLHILRDGDTIGMLSVHGDSAQVFPHTWHGDFIEMSEE